MGVGGEEGGGGRRTPPRAVAVAVAHACHHRCPLSGGKRGERSRRRSGGGRERGEEEKWVRERERERGENKKMSGKRRGDFLHEGELRAPHVKIPIFSRVDILSGSLGKIDFFAYASLEELYGKMWVDL